MFVNPFARETEDTEDTEDNTEDTEDNTEDTEDNEIPVERLKNVVLQILLEEKGKVPKCLCRIHYEVEVEYKYTNATEDEVLENLNQLVRNKTIFVDGCKYSIGTPPMVDQEAQEGQVPVQKYSSEILLISFMKQQAVKPFCSCQLEEAFSKECDATITREKVKKILSDALELGYVSKIGWQFQVRSACWNIEDQAVKSDVLSAVAVPDQPEMPVQKEVSMNPVVDNSIASHRSLPIADVPQSARNAKQAYAKALRRLAEPPVTRSRSRSPIGEEEDKS